MKLLRQDNSAARQGQTKRTREMEAVHHQDADYYRRDTVKVGSADPNRQLKDCRLQAAGGKRLGDVQRPHAVDS